MKCFYLNEVFAFKKNCRNQWRIQTLPLEKFRFFKHEVSIYQKKENRSWTDCWKQLVCLSTLGESKGRDIKIIVSIATQWINI